RSALTTFGDGEQISRAERDSLSERMRDGTISEKAVIVPRIARSPFIFIGALLGFTLASLWGVTAWKSAQEKARAFAQAGSETQGLTHSLAQHASKTFGAVTLALL